MQAKFACESGHLEDAKKLEQEIGGEERSDFAGVVRWRDFDEIAANDVQPLERADEFDDLMAGKAADLGSAGAGSIGRIDGIDIESDVDGFAAEGFQVRKNRRQALFVKQLGSDHADSVLAREVEIVFAVNLAAETDLKDAAVCEEAFFESSAEGRAMGIFAAEIFVP
jgi:hypothetical protein